MLSQVEHSKVYNSVASFTCDKVQIKKAIFSCVIVCIKIVYEMKREIDLLLCALLKPNVIKCEIFMKC